MLTEAGIRAAKASEKPYKLFDGSGLYLLVNPNGSRASTCLNEQRWSSDVIELQLAHSERDEVRGAYNCAQRLADRRKMMQAWADYLDQLRTRAETDLLARTA